MYLRWYFIFAQLKATLRAGWTGVGVGGQRAEDREAEVILLPRCLVKLGPARAGGRGRQGGCGLEGSWACVCKLYLILGLHPVTSLGLFLLNCVSRPRDKLAPERCLREHKHLGLATSHLFQFSSALLILGLFSYSQSLPLFSGSVERVLSMGSDM